MEGRRIDRVVLWREVIIGEVLDVECVYPEPDRELLAAKRLVSAAVDALFWPEDDMDDPGPHDLATAIIGATAAAYTAGVVDVAEVWRPLATEWATGDFTDKGPELRRAVVDDDRRPRTPRQHLPGRALVVRRR